MTSLLLQFVFIALLVILPMALYRSRRSFIAVFYRAMTDNAQARKFYTAGACVVLLLLFHYVYTTGHPGQFGTVLSCHRMCRHVLRQEDGQMAPQAARPSEGICRLRRLRTGSMCRAAGCSPCPLPSHISFWQPCSIPPAEFWPTGRTGTGDFTCREHPDEMSDIYHCNHHARLP